MGGCCLGMVVKVDTRELGTVNLVWLQSIWTTK